MKTLDFNEMEVVEGGVPLKEYCAGLKNFILGDGYQGDFVWLLVVYAYYC